MSSYRAFKKAKLEAATPHPTLPREFLLLLAESTVENACALNGKLITVHRNDSLSFAFKKLISNSIHSVPVLKQDDTFYGFLDTLDIVTWVVDKMGEYQVEEIKDLGEHPSLQKEEVRNVVATPNSKKAPKHMTLKQGTSLLSAMEMLADGAHRIAIVDEDNLVKNIISQSTVLEFLKLYKDKLGELKQMKVEDMEASIQYVLSATEYQRAYDAFKLMEITGAQAIAVTNDDGQIVGNISARDFKKIASTGRFLSRLFQPASQYVSAHAPITVTGKDTLEKILSEITSKKIHQVYVINEEKHPIGIISVSDVMKILLKKKGSVSEQPIITSIFFDLFGDKLLI